MIMTCSNFYFSQPDPYRKHPDPNRSKWLELQCLQRLQAPRFRSLLRPLIPRCRSLHWCCWWCRCSCQRPKRHLRRSHSYSHLRWSPRSVRFDYFHHSVIRLDQLLIKLSILLRLVGKHLGGCSVALTAIWLNWLSCSHTSLTLPASSAPVISY